MAEINISIDGMNEALASFGALRSSWGDRRSSLSSIGLQGSGGTPELAHDIADSYKEVYDRLVKVASNTEGFFSNVQASMAKADASSPFER